MYFTSSWDDGHPLDSKLADLMVRHGITGTFYYPIRNGEGLPVLPPAALRELDGPFEIGSHTLEHAYADRMSAAHWKEQVLMGRERLENIVGHSIDGFCYPGGKTKSESRDIVAAAGFLYARTVENFRLECGNDLFSIPTSIQFFPHSKQVLLGNFINRGRWNERAQLFAACISAANFDDRMIRILELCIKRDATFHLWGHSWEIEQHGLWPNLDRLFARIASTVAKNRRLTNGAVLRAQRLLD